MKVINANTKIASLINANSDAIDAIASINPHFKKLKNPVLRKIFAARVTISDAAKIGKCSIDDFFDKLKPLGFIIDQETTEQGSLSIQTDTMTRPYDVKLDVREDIEYGHDPFKKIMKCLSDMATGNVLLLINSFEPTPLIRILEDRYYTIEVITINEEEVHTYIRKNEGTDIERSTEEINEETFEVVAGRYENKMQIIDVRQLPMPQPMITILSALESLPVGMALFVHHKKIPKFLLPELKKKEFSLVFKPAEGGVKLIIYKRQQG